MTKQTERYCYHEKITTRWAGAYDCHSRGSVAKSRRGNQVLKTCFVRQCQNIS